MISMLKRKLVFWYYTKIRKYSEVDINIMNMRRSGITVGEKCRIFTSVQSIEPYLISIGNNVTISSGVEFCTHDNAVIKAIPGKTDVVGRITVCDNCFIGMNSILMYGVTVGENSIVGAGAVVTRNVPPHTVVAGNPARIICTTEEYAAKNQAYAFDFSNIPRSQRKDIVLSNEDRIIKR